MSPRDLVAAWRQTSRRRGDEVAEVLLECAEELEIVLNELETPRPPIAELVRQAASPLASCSHGYPGGLCPRPECRTIWPE